jgi:hypothetical protein
MVLYNSTKQGVLLNYYCCGLSLVFTFLPKNTEGDKANS